MQHVISTQEIGAISQQSNVINHPGADLVHRFITWCTMQETRRFIWLAVSFVAGIGTILPLTLFAIIIGGHNNFNLWITACIVNISILVVNLAGQPLKVILPVLFSAWLIDITIITYCFGSFFMR